MVVSNDTRTIGRSPSLSRLGSFKRSDTLELENVERASKPLSSVRSHRSASEFDEMASLALSGSDDATDSSDDSYSSRNAKTDRRRRRCRKEAKTNTRTNEDVDYTNAKDHKQCEVGKYMAAREMTPFQERMNALTVLPSTYYCIMYVLSGSWLSTLFIEGDGNDLVDKVIFDESQCISSSWLPHLHALPPLPVLAAAIGILCHAPFSMIYHWKYAHRLPAGLPRTTHWSRRMDQAMIHFCSACFAYSTSGRFDFFLANALFNLDCMYRQFLKQVRPRRNQVRIGISILAYTIPILKRGDFFTFFYLSVLFAIGGWLFGQYPIGGWSHSAFHIVMAFVPPIMFMVALDLPASQSQLKVAAQCAILAENTFVS